MSEQQKTAARFTLLHKPEGREVKIVVGDSDDMAALANAAKLARELFPSDDWWVGDDEAQVVFLESPDDDLRSYEPHDKLPIECANFLQAERWREAGLCRALLV
jgi:hypothetical protein